MLPTLVKSRSRIFTPLLLLTLLLTACQPIQKLPAMQSSKAIAAETSLEAANKALVLRVYDEIMNQKNLSVAGELFAPNMVIHQFDPAGQGLDLGMLITALPDLHATVDRLQVEGDMVTSMVTISGTQQMEFMGIAPTGNPVTWTHIDFSRVEDGKIVEVWHNLPLADILQQIQNGPNLKTGAATDPSVGEADLIRTIERTRLKGMVDADMAVVTPLYTDDFQLINPGGGALSKEEYLGFVASGDVDYLVWEPIAEIAVRLYGLNTAIIRYQSQIDIIVFGEKDSIHAWHTDLYEKREGQWQVVWSQATEIQP